MVREKYWHRRRIVRHGRSAAHVHSVYTVLTTYNSIQFGRVSRLNDRVTKAMINGKNVTASTWRNQRQWREMENWRVKKGGNQSACKPASAGGRRKLISENLESISGWRIGISNARHDDR